MLLDHPTTNKDLQLTGYMILGVTGFRVAHQLVQNKQYLSLNIGYLSGDFVPSNSESNLKDIHQKVFTCFDILDRTITRYGTVRTYSHPRQPRPLRSNALAESARADSAN